MPILENTRLLSGSAVFGQAPKIPICQELPKNGNLSKIN